MLKPVADGDKRYVPPSMHCLLHLSVQGQIRRRAAASPACFRVRADKLSHLELSINLLHFVVSAVFMCAGCIFVTLPNNESEHLLNAKTTVLQEETQRNKQTNYSQLSI